MVRVPSSMLQIVAVYTVYGIDKRRINFFQIFNFLTPSEVSGTDVRMA